MACEQLEPTSYNGLSVNAATPYIMSLRQDPYGSGPYEAEPLIRSRVNLPPVQETITFKERRILFRIARGSGTRADFLSNVSRFFTPFGGLRTLNVTYEDGTTAITAQADVVALERVHPDAFDGIFLLPDPIWRRTTTSTDSVSPLTVLGNYFALPSIAITPVTSTVRRRRVTITDGGSPTAKGLVNYPVRILFDSTGVAASATSNYIVFYKGRSIPFAIFTINNASTELWVRVDVPPDGSTTVDIYYGSSVNNTVTNNKLATGGLDLDNSTNTLWKWTQGAPFNDPNFGLGVPGSWTPAKTGNHVSGSFGRNSTDSSILQVRDDDTLANDFDSYVLVVGSRADATGTELDNLSRVLDEATNGIVKAFVRYRKYGETVWNEAWSALADGTVTTAIAVTDAVEIAVGIENQGGTATLASTLTLDDDGTALQLALAGVPTVSVASAVTARLIDATLTNTTTADTIVFDDVYLDNVVLTIDCLAKTITAASGPWYGSITFSDPDNWMDLAIGSNAWTNPTNATAAFTWRNRFVA